MEWQLPGNRTREKWAVVQEVVDFKDQLYNLVATVNDVMLRTSSLGE